MADDILFQRDRLTVTKNHLIVGRVTAFYSSISAVSIYDGRPLLPSAIMSAFGLIPLALMFVVFRQLLGPYFQIKFIALPFLPLVAFVIVGFMYRVKCLFVTIDGQAVAVLKSKDMAVLEQAKTKIEEAKTGTTSRNA